MSNDNKVVVTETITDSSIELIVNRAHEEIVELATNTGYSPVIDKNKIMAICVKTNTALIGSGHKWSQINWSEFKETALRVSKTNINPHEQAHLYIIPRKGKVNGIVTNDFIALDIMVGYLGIYNEDMKSNTNGVTRCAPFMVREGDNFDIVRKNGTIIEFAFNKVPFNNEKSVGIIFLAYDKDDNIIFGEDFNYDKMVKDGKARSKMSSSPAWKDHEDQMAKRTAYNKFRKWFTFDNQDEAVRAFNEIIEAEFKEKIDNNQNDAVNLTDETIAFNKQ